MAWIGSLIGEVGVRGVVGLIGGRMRRLSGGGGLIVIIREIRISSPVTIDGMHNSWHIFVLLLLLLRLLRLLWRRLPSRNRPIDEGQICKAYFR